MAQWLAHWIGVRSIQRTKKVERSRVRFPFGPMTFFLLFFFLFAFFWAKERIELRSSRTLRNHEEQGCSAPESCGTTKNRAFLPRMGRFWGEHREAEEHWGTPRNSQCSGSSWKEGNSPVLMWKEGERGRTACASVERGGTSSTALVPLTEIQSCC